MCDADSVEQEYEQFLYRVTHDLKTYMRAIRVIPGWINEDMLRNDVAVPFDVSENLSMLENYVGGMDRMLEGLTALSRVNRNADSSSDHDFADLITSVWQKVSGSERVSLLCEVEAVQVAGPLNELHQLLSGLLDNAVRFGCGESGQVFVSAQQSGPRVFVEIVDEGPGIPTEFRRAAFEPLRTLQPKDDSGTAGIGLAIAKKVVKTLGGTINISDGPNGTGCRVSFDLPATTSLHDDVAA